MSTAEKAEPAGSGSDDIAPRPAAAPPAASLPWRGGEKDGPRDAQAGLPDDGEVLRGPHGEVYPTRQELATLRRVRGQIGWLIYTIAFCELCERFAWYGTTQVFVNFIAEPLPAGSTTGAGGTHAQAGAYGMGQQASTGITLFNNFWAYIMPLLGGYMSDSYWGKYKTINVAMSVRPRPGKGSSEC